MANKQSKTKNIVASLRFTPEQYAAIQDRAEQRGVRTSVWMRTIVLQAANSPINSKRLIQIREPNGATT